MAFSKLKGKLRDATRSEKFKFDTEDYNATLDPELVTVIIFIRHGTSCANLRKESIPGYRFTHTDIVDPGLTRKGIYDAQQQGRKLRGKLIRNYGVIKPIVCASVLLRTQMTGYLMMNPNLNSEYDIRILPYISEAGSTNDNKPRNFKQQQEMLDRLEPTFIKMNRTGYTYYKEQAHLDKLEPNFPMFIEELKKLCNKNEENRIGSVATTQCSLNKKTVNISERDTRTAYAPIVIVTHGHVLGEFFETMGRKLKDKSERPNFSAFRVYFNNKTGKFIKNPIDTSDTNEKNHKQLSYFYQYDDKLKDKLDKTTECEWEDAHKACESVVCDPNANVTSTQSLGGRRTRKRTHASLKTGQKVRGKGRQLTQKNS
jgi:broad specificity phosphatase PhoE